MEILSFILLGGCAVVWVYMMFRVTDRRKQPD